MTDAALAVAEKILPRGRKRQYRSGSRDLRPRPPHDRKEQTVDENLRVLRWVARNLPGRRYNVRRRVAIPGGFLQQHVLEGQTAAGPFATPARIICEVAGGRITRLEEYLDSAQAARLAALARGGKVTAGEPNQPPP